MTPIIILGYLLLTASAAQTADDHDANLLEHSYYDCSELRPEIASRNQAGEETCRVYYSVRDDLVAVVLKDPHQALQLRELALKDPNILTRCYDSKAPSDAMELVTVGKDQPRLAGYEHLGQCRDENEILWLAERLTKLKSSPAEIAGPLVRLVQGSGQYILLDQVILEVGPHDQRSGIAKTSGCRFRQIHSCRH